MGRRLASALKFVTPEATIASKVGSGRLLFPVRPNEDDHSNHKCDSAVDGPFDLPGHKASRQHIDSLEEPHAAEKDQDRAHDIQYDSHVPP